jgi:hypothetical protein
MRIRAALGLGALLGVVIVGGAGLMLLRQENLRTVERQSHTVAEAIRQVATLATVEMSLSNWQLRRDERPLFKVLPIQCRKTVAVFYRGKVSAGFDLSPLDGPGLRVTADATRRRVEIRLPAPRLLSTDVPAPEVVVADGSLCNQVTPEDYARLHQDAREAIGREAVSAGILAKAESHARDLLGGVVRSLGYELDLHVGPLPLATSAETSGPAAP